MAKSRAITRYNRRVLILSLIYATLLVGVITLFKRDAPSGPIAYFAAILPALPIIGIFAAIGRYLVEETDEYLRVMMTRQALIATAFALSIVTAWGFLENFRLVPHVHAYYTAVLWFAGLGVGGFVNKLQSARDAA